MEEILSGIILMTVVGYLFYIIAKKLNISEENHDDDDFSCH